MNSRANPIIFVRSPRIERMLDPLQSPWNRELADRDAASPRPGTIDLAALVDFSQMNDTFANYLEVVGLPVAIIDLNGKVLASSRWQRLCMAFHRIQPDTLARCIESDVSLSMQMQEGKGYALYRCRNGLTDCAAPIRIEGQHIANLFIGQFLLAPPDLDEFERQRAQFGFERAAYFEALSEVPIIDEARVPAIMQLLVGLADQVARQSLAQHRLNERNAALAAAKDAAEASSRAKTAFLSNVSHEMRTPLNHIHGMATLIRREPLSARQSERMDRLEAATRNLTSMIETVLELSRLEAGKFDRKIERFSLRDLLQGAVDAVMDRAEAKALPILIEASDLPDDLMGCAACLKEALRHYLDNAIRFTETGFIALRAVPLEEEEQGLLARFEVDDTGIGIPLADQSRLFTLFEQVDNSSTRRFNGLGVGLAMTQKLAQVMGGDAGYESQYDQGSRFWFSARVMRA